jgi:cell wall-associated NlpC family hydrolase
MLAKMSGSSVAIQQFPGRLARGAATAVVAVACLLATPAAALAAGVNPSDGQISAAQKAAGDAAAQVGTIAAELATAESQAGRAEAAANIALGRFESTQADYQRAEAAAQQAQDVARQADAARAEAQAKVGAFARSSYVEGSTSPGFAAALTADGPAQLLERTALLAAANAHRTDVLAEMTTAAQRAADAGAAATVALGTAAAVKQLAQAALTTATDLEVRARQQAGALKAQQTALRARLQTAQQHLLGLQNARAAAVADEQRQAAARAAAAAASSNAVVTLAGSRGSTAAARTAIGAALRYVGQMYAWGGGSLNGPSWGWGPDVGVVGFDCSGLTRYAYAQAGISIPRVAADQYAALPKVSSLRPGDLVFYATDPNDPATIHHVAMYLGSGQMIEAPESGERVHVTAMRYGYEYIGAVRPGA